MSNYIIKNAIIVNEGKKMNGDVLIKDGRIDKIATSLETPNGVTEINAEGMYLIPGAIDDQVHFREPGLTHKANIYTESKAAVFALLSMEGLAVTLLGALLGVALLAALSAILGPLAAARFGLAVEVRIITLEELRLLGAVVGVGLLACLIPGYRAYKLSLADGLTPRI